MTHETARETSRWRDAVWLCAYLLLAFLRLWPLSLHAGTRLADDGDAPFSLWAVWWGATHVSAGYPGLFNANVYYPHPGGLLYAESHLAEALVGYPVFKALDDAVLAINVVTVITFGLSAFAFHLWARELVGGDAAAALGAVFYAFNSYTLSNVPRLQIVSLQWIPLGLLALHRFFARPSAGRAFAFALFSALVGMACFYYLLFYLTALALIIPVYLWVHRAWERPRLLLTLGGATLACGAVLAAVALPYFRLYQLYGFGGRPLNPFDLSFYVVPPAGNLFYRGAAEALRASGYSLDYFLGYVAVALGALGALALLLQRPRPRGHAVWIAYIALGVAAALLAAGLEIHWRGTAIAQGPFALLKRLGAFAELREARRFSVLVNLCLGLCVARGAAALLTRLPARRRGWVSLLLALLVAGEHWAPRHTRGIEVPAGPDVPEVYRWLASRPGAEPVVELPARPVRLTHSLAMEMYFAAIHHKPSVMGWPSFVPPALELLRFELRDFPDRRSVLLLRALGVRLTLVHPKRWGRERPDRVRRLTKGRDGLTLLREFPDRPLPVWSAYQLGEEQVYALPPLEAERPPRSCACVEIDPRSFRVVANAGNDPRLAVDGRRDTSWTSSVRQQEGFFFEILFDRLRRPARVEIEMAFPYGEFARSLEITGYRSDEPHALGPVEDLWYDVALLRQLVADPKRARLRYELTPATVERLRLSLGPTERGTGAWSIPEIHVYESTEGSETAPASGGDR